MWCGWDWYYWLTRRKVHFDDIVWVTDFKEQDWWMGFEYNLARPDEMRWTIETRDWVQTNGILWDGTRKDRARWKEMRGDERRRDEVFLNGLRRPNEFSFFDSEWIYMDLIMVIEVHGVLWRKHGRPKQSNAAQRRAEQSAFEVMRCDASSVPFVSVQFRLHGCPDNRLILS